MATAMVAGGVTVGAIQVSTSSPGTGVFDERDRELLEGCAPRRRCPPQCPAPRSKSAAHDLALLLEISREITATLDLDRVLRSVVNLASHALSFDRGAVGLYEKGKCEIRAVAGQETADPKDPKLRDLWPAPRGPRGGASSST